MENNFADKKIIGLTGLIVSGKNTAAEYLVNKYNATILGCSRPLRKILSILSLEEKRQNMQNLSLALRNTFGEAIISQALIGEIEKIDNNFIVIEGLRRPDDYKAFKKFSNFILIAVEVDEKTRYERLIARSQNTDDKTKTFAQFLSDQVAEAERDIPNIMSKADYKINNNGDFDNLYKQIDEVMGKIKN